MATVISYGTNLLIDSSELKRIKISQTLNIREFDTWNAFTINQPGNISPIRWTIETTIRRDSTTKFNTLMTEISTRPLRTLNIFKLNYPQIYFTNLDITASELNQDGDILWFDSTLDFVQSINFGI